jgi:hypothetical protein
MYIVDRRLNPGGKSFANRERFLRRAKDLVKRAVRESSRDRGVEDLESAGEVKIPVDGIREPKFRRGPGDRRDIVLPGNREFVEGDQIERPPGGGGGGSGSEAGQGMDGEDGFSFVLSREEFLSIFLEDLELPDLAKRRLGEVEVDGIRRAGYTTTGSPANLALGRSLQTSLARRVALGRPGALTLAEWERQLVEAEASGDASLAEALKLKIEHARTKRSRISFLDPLDLRYRRFEPFPKPVTQAVMFCLMDVSGSMTEHMKTVAKCFFMLLHVFLTRRYEKVAVVFIRHTDKASEVDQETFFHATDTGGTLVSSALEEMRRVMRERFDPAIWNIYAAQASDGDNAHADNSKVDQLMRSDILPHCQYFAYIEVSGSETVMPGLRPHATGTNLWRTYQPIQRDVAQFQMRRAASRDEIYPVFRDLFGQRQGAGQVA